MTLSSGHWSSPQWWQSMEVFLLITRNRWCRLPKHQLQRNIRFYLLFLAPCSQASRYCSSFASVLHVVCRRNRNRRFLFLSSYWKISFQVSDLDARSSFRTGTDILWLLAANKSKPPPWLVFFMVYCWDLRSKVQWQHKFFLQFGSLRGDLKREECSLIIPGIWVLTKKVFDWFPTPISRHRQLWGRLNVLH